MSLMCHKPNLFRYTYDFPITRIVTLDLKWIASHCLKRILWPNIKRNKITNNKTKLYVLTISTIIYDIDTIHY